MPCPHGEAGRTPGEEGPALTVDQVPPLGGKPRPLEPGPAHWKKAPPQMGQTPPLEAGLEYWTCGSGRGSDLPPARLPVLRCSA